MNFQAHAGCNGRWLRNMLRNPAPGMVENLYPLVNVYIAIMLLKMAIEIVDLLGKTGDVP